MKWILFFVAVVLFIGIRGILKYRKMLADVEDSTSYKNVQGKIKGAELWYRIDENKESGDIPLFDKVLWYEYQVGDNTYKALRSTTMDSDALQYYKPVSQAPKHHEWITGTDRYTKALSEISTRTRDTTITVYYNPSNPEISRLSTEASPTLYYRYIAYYAMVFLALLVLSLALRNNIF